MKKPILRTEVLTQQKCKTCRDATIPCPSPRLLGPTFVMHFVERRRKGKWIHPVEVYETNKGAFRAVFAGDVRVATTSRTINRAVDSLLKKLRDRKLEVGENLKASEVAAK